MKIIDAFCHKVSFACPYCGLEHSLYVNKNHEVGDFYQCYNHDEEGCGKRFVLRLVPHVTAKVCEINEPLGNFLLAFRLSLINEGVDVDDLAGVKLESVISDFIKFVRDSEVQL